MDITYSCPWYTGDADKRRDALRALADAGIFNLVLANEIIESAFSSPELFINARKDMAEFGIKFMDAHAPWGTWKDPGMPLEDYHEMVVLRQKMAIRICNECGVGTMAFHTGNTINSIFGTDLTLKDYYSMLLRSLEELLPDAERYGVVIALENQWTPLNQTACLIGAMKHFNSPWLGLCYDAGHANLVENGKNFPGESVVPVIWEDAGIPVVWEENMVDKMQPWIVNCHIHDNDGKQDQHRLPGKGTVDWPGIMKALLSAPRLQCIQSEVSIKDGSPELGELKAVFEGLVG